LVLSCDDFIKVDLPFAKVFEDSLIADLLNTYFFDLFVEFVPGKDAYADDVSEPSWKYTCTSDVLVTFGGVDVHFNNNFETFFALALLGDLSGSFEDFCGLVQFFDDALSGICCHLFSC
jgi:hypothetical protein